MGGVISAARAGALPVAFVGGITTLHPLIRPALETALAEYTVTFPQIDAAAHAAQYARTLFGPNS